MNPMQTLPIMPAPRRAMTVIPRELRKANTPKIMGMQAMIDPAMALDFRSNKISTFSIASCWDSSTRRDSR